MDICSSSLYFITFFLYITLDFTEPTDSSSSSSSSSDNETSDVLSEISETKSLSGEQDTTSGEVIGKAEVRLQKFFHNLKNLVHIFLFSEFQVIADFVAEHDFELNVKTGDIVTIISKLNDLWLEGSFQGQTGVLPVDFIKWIEPSPEPEIIGNPG